MMSGRVAAAPEQAGIEDSSLGESDDDKPSATAPSSGEPAEKADEEKGEKEDAKGEEAEEKGEKEGEGEEEEEKVEPGIAGYDDGFFIQDKSGNYRLVINEVAQFRYYFNYRPSILSEEDKHITHGFEFTKALIAFSGNLFTKDFEYELELEAESGALQPDVFVLSYDVGGGFKFILGQFDLPVLREEIVDELGVSAHTSLVTSAFALDVTQGVGLEYEAEALRVNLVVCDGRDQGNTIFTSPSEADLAVAARFELKLGGGDWDRYEQFTSWRGSKFGALIGAAAYYEMYGHTGAFNFGENEDAVASPVLVEKSQLLEYTVDFTFQGNGWNVFFAGVSTHEMVPGDNPFDDFGIIAHAAVFLADQIETFARFDVLLEDQKRLPEENQPFKTLDVGFNLYFAPHSEAVKLTLDVQYFFDRPDLNLSSVELMKENDVGLLPTAGKGQVVGKAQVQFMF
jgi:hypothetical protein